MGFIGDLSMEDVLKSVLLATLRASPNASLRSEASLRASYHTVLDALDDGEKELTFALIQDHCAREIRRSTREPDRRGQARGDDRSHGRPPGTPRRAAVQLHQDFPRYLRAGPRAPVRPCSPAVSRGPPPGPACCDGSQRGAPLGIGVNHADRSGVALTGREEDDQPGDISVFLCNILEANNIKPKQVLKAKNLPTNDMQDAFALQALFEAAAPYMPETVASDTESAGTDPS